MAVRNQEFFDGNLPAGFDGLFDWDFLVNAHCFGIGTGIEPMDIDATVERNRRFIIFETKSKGSPIPFGQNRTLKALHQLGCFTVIVLRMSEEKKEIVQIQHAFPNSDSFITIKDKSPMDMAKELVKIVKHWYYDADQFGHDTIHKDLRDANIKNVMVGEKLTFWQRLKILFR